MLDEATHGIVRAITHFLAEIGQQNINGAVMAATWLGGLKPMHGMIIYTLLIGSIVSAGTLTVRGIISAPSGIAANAQEIRTADMERGTLRGSVDANARDIQTITSAIAVMQETSANVRDMVFRLYCDRFPEDCPATRAPRIR